MTDLKEMSNEELVAIYDDWINAPESIFNAPERCIEIKEEILARMARGKEKA